MFYAPHPLLTLTTSFQGLGGWCPTSMLCMGPGNTCPTAQRFHCLWSRWACQSAGVIEWAQRQLTVLYLWAESYFPSLCRHGAKGSPRPVPIQPSALHLVGLLRAQIEEQREAPPGISRGDRWGLQHDNGCGSSAGESTVPLLHPSSEWGETTHTHRGVNAQLLTAFPRLQSPLHH